LLEVASTIVEMFVFFVVLLASSDGGLESKSLPRKSVCIYALVTFHHVKGESTAYGLTEAEWMAASNTSDLKKDPIPPDAKLQIFAYYDRKTTQRWIVQKLPQRTVADKLGPASRLKASSKMAVVIKNKKVLKPYYHVDYYYSGKMTQAMENCNKKVCKIKVTY